MISATSSFTSGDIEEKRADACTYVVQRGDTLAGVALRLGVKQSQLKRANRLYGSKTLITGQLLKVTIPNDQTAVSTGANAGDAVTVTATATAPDAAGASFPAPRSDVQPHPEGDEVTTALRPALAATAGNSVEFPAAKTVAPTSVTTIATANSFSGVATPQDEEDLSSTDGADLEAATPLGKKTRRQGKGCVGADGPSQEDGPKGRKAGAAGGETDNPQPDKLVISRAFGQPSDASSSSAATTGVSIRNAVRFMFSPTPSAASKGGCEIFSENPASNAVAIDNGAIIQPPLDEPWPLDRESRAGSAAQFPPRSAREASDASSTMSTAQTLLAMVTPRVWRSGEWGNTEDGERAGTGDAADGDNEPNGICYTAAYRGDEEGTIAESLASDDAGGDVLTRAAPSPASLKLPTLIAGSSTIVTHSTLARMEQALSKHHRGYNWYLLFSTYRDGASYATMYNNIKQEEPTYVVVESMNGEVFGGFAASAWSSGCQYYGTGQCFLYKIEGGRTTCESGDASEESAADDAGGKATMNGEVVSYEWTGMNTYLQYSDCAGLGMGGGGKEAAFGLFVGDDFLNGSTGSCDTFSNPPLCSQRQFQISQVEIWGFTTAETEMGARLERLRKTLRGKTTRPL